MSLSKAFTAFASGVARWAGSPAAFVASVGIVLAWAVSGPIFGFTDTWQLVINTGTTIVTFLMVFVIQNSQNRDSEAIQAKLDEIIRTSKAQDSYIGIEHLTEKELDEMRALSERRVKEGKAEGDRRKGAGETSDEER